jgi:hypothetical protein
MLTKKWSSFKCWIRGGSTGLGSRSGTELSTDFDVDPNIELDAGPEVEFRDVECDAPTATS